MLKELQSLDEATKKRVLIIATIIIMVIVVGIWVIYFNSIVIGGAADQSAATATSTPATISTPAASGPGLWQDIKNGFGNFVNLFQKPSQYNVQPSGN